MSAHDRNLSYHIPAAGSRSTIRISMDDSVFRSENSDYYSHQQAPRHHAGCCSALARLAAAPNPTRIQRNTVLRNGHIPSASKQNKQSTGIASNPNPMPQPKQKRASLPCSLVCPATCRCPSPKRAPSACAPAPDQDPVFSFLSSS